MGQQRSKTCPICDGPNDGRWACGECSPLVSTHRELLRNLQVWEHAYVSGEASDTLSDGVQEFSLWDVRQFYASRVRLAPGQEQAIRLCLYENVAERQAAVMMGISPRSPVAIYATVGITRLLRMAREGTIPYRLEDTA